jgi:hypothetical protein
MEKVSVGITVRQALNDGYARKSDGGIEVSSVPAMQFYLQEQQRVIQEQADQILLLRAQLAHALSVADSVMVTVTKATIIHEEE